MRLHHTGIISRGIELDLPVYIKLGYKQLGEPIIDPVQSNRLVFLLSADGSLLELIEPQNERSTVKNAAPGLHHICYEVDDLDIELQRIKNERLGVVFTDVINAPAFNNRRIAFIYLRTKLIMELLEV